MSDLKINNITNSSGDGGPVIAGVSTVSTSAFMIMPGGNTEIRGAGSGRGVMAGGAESLSSPYTISDRMQFITIASTGNTTDFGNLSLARYYVRGTASSTRGVFAGGTYPSPAVTNTIDYVIISSGGGANDFGDMSINRNGIAAFGNQTRGVFAGGYTTPTNTHTSLMEFVNIANVGTTSDFGTLSVSRELMAGFASPTRGIIAGGAQASTITNLTADIQFVTLATGGDSQRFGELVRLRFRLPGASNSTRGLTFGGRYPGQVGVDEIDYITIATEGNAQDFGNLTAAVHESGALASSTRGINFGGESAPASGALFNTIDYVTIATTGNATDFGDLLAVVGDDPAGCSDVHGGLG